ncbi:MAG: hypothetical protein A2Y73_01750 [Chloroflexi bacterium RBG_13_56_8]|nr:MAG: hypothetical protein A2Y73_01750 [Chloroflexi bacterium RBG_13_56_8]
MSERLGTVRISSQVLATIARLATLAVPGVLRMYRDLSSGMDRLWKGRGAGDGIRVEVIDDAVLVDIAVIVAHEVNIYEVGCEIQARVSRAIKDMVGMPVLAVNVHVENVESAPTNE